MSPQLGLRASQRMATTMVSRRMFHATRARFSSPYHYPEGPYSNLPFNVKTRFFGLRYWLFCITGFSAPFLIARASFPPSFRPSILLTLEHSLANLQAQGVDSH
jgi:cytochrome c oxidase subunit 7c